MTDQNPSKHEPDGTSQTTVTAAEAMTQQERASERLEHNLATIQDLQTRISRHLTFYKSLMAGFTVAFVVVVIFLVSIGIKSSKLENKVETLTTPQIMVRLKQSESNLSNMEARLSLLLEATDDENVRSVTAAFQRFNDMEDRIGRTEASIDKVYGWVIGLLTGGLIATVSIIGALIVKLPKAETAKE